MKVVKPQKVGLLTKTIEHEGRFLFAVAPIVFFPFGNPEALLSEIAMWKFLPEELGKDAVLDAGVPKLRGEVLVHGKAYPAGRRPHPACTVRVRIGSVNKTLLVIGDREWRSATVTQPVPFSEMPITYERAFGGEGFPQNPLGKGFIPRGESEARHPLPNIEDPRRPVRAPKDRPMPAGLSGYDLTWPQRFSKAGTYDARWLETRFPGLAADADWGLFNEAPDDQQIHGYFHGGEPFELENLHPEKALISGRLPYVTTRVFVTVETDKGLMFREVVTRLETIKLFPHAEKGVLLFRGVIDVTEDDASDVKHLLVAAEAMGQPKSRKHYESVLTTRLDKQKGALHALRDIDLLPPPVPNAPRERDPMDELTATEQLLAKNLRRKAEREREAARALLVAAGIDPEKNLPPLPPEPGPPPSADDIPAAVEQAQALGAQLQAEAEQRRKQGLEELEKLCAAQGIDLKKKLAERGQGGGPPKFSAKSEVKRIRELRDAARAQGLPTGPLDARLSDPELEQRMLQAEEKLRDAYRRFAQHYPSAAPLEGEAMMTARQVVFEQHRARNSLARWDLTGANLSNMDLRGADFRGAFLECASFVGSDLTGANFEDAVLTRGDFTDANLSGTNLRGANLGLAKLHRANASGGVDATRAVLFQADFSSANFAGAVLTGADLMQAVFDGADFSNVTAVGMSFLRSRLAGVRLTGATLTKCNFLEVDVEGVDFSGATLSESVFLTSKGDGANFRGAVLEKLRVVHGSSFARADFQEARMREANLRGTNLTAAKFNKALLESADLSECDLRDAQFYRAVARDARFIKADLTGAMMVSIDLRNAIVQKARIAGASLQGANLFRADFARVRGKARDMTDAFSLRVRYLPRSPNG